MTLESGPARGDRIYFTILTVLCVGMFAYFIYDWQIGYPESNRKEAREKLAALLAVDKETVTIPEPERPLKPDFVALKEQEGTVTPEQVRAAFGEPILTAEQDGVSYEYYASDYGMATVPLRSGRVQQAGMAWLTWYKTKEEVEGQLWWSFIPAAFGLYAIRRLIMATTLRIVVDDNGMTYAGRKIPFDAMQDLRDYNSKGWVDLYYDAGGRRQKLRLDNQKIAKFNEVVVAICEKKGFENPLPTSGETDNDEPAENT